MSTDITNTAVEQDLYDANGFHRETRIHRDTNTLYDAEGYNSNGYDERGWDRNDEHYDTGTEFDHSHRTRDGSRYDSEGYNWCGRDSEGYDRDGYDSDGYDVDGNDSHGNSRCDNGDCDDSDCACRRDGSDELLDSDACVLEETDWIRSLYRPTAATIAFEFECHSIDTANSAANFLLGNWNFAYESLVNNTRTGEGAICKHDGSLDERRGVEFVTVPMLLDEHRNVLRRAFHSKFGDGRVNAWGVAKCGMHVHLARASLTNLTLGKMLCFMHGTANTAFHVSIAGRHSTYAAFSGYNAKVAKGLPKNAHTDKYSALNVKAHTVEFRIFRPSCQFETLLKNLCYCLAVRDFCKQSSLASTALTWDRFLTWLGTTDARRTYRELDAWLRRQTDEFGTFYNLHAKPLPKPKPAVVA